MADEALQLRSAQHEKQSGLLVEQKLVLVEQKARADATQRVITELQEKLQADNEKLNSLTSAIKKLERDDEHAKAVTAQVVAAFERDSHVAKCLGIVQDRVLAQKTRGPYGTPGEPPKDITRELDLMLPVCCPDFESPDLCRGMGPGVATD